MAKNDPASQAPITDTRAKLLPKFTLFFFSRPRLTILLWLLIFSFGIASYTTFLKREGFPQIVIPYSYVTGPYLVNNADKVDKQVAKPLSDIIGKDKDVKNVQTQASANFFNVVVQYHEGANTDAANSRIEQAVAVAHVLPAEAKPEFKTLSPGVTQRGDDILISFYATNGKTSTQELTKKAQAAADYINSSANIPLSRWVKIIDPFVRGTDPATGQPAVSQSTFDAYGARQGQSSNFYRSITIGVKGTKGFDVLTLDKQVLSSLDKLNTSPDFTGFRAERFFSPAPEINSDISNLQQSLLEGLTAVLVISAILIALRASFITVLSMALVITTVLGVLFLIGYSLNVITLFSLVLCLSLIVDDTIIMVEAIDAQRRKHKSARQVVSVATKKISRAMVAATLTAALGFAPLIFVGGILGSFIRAIPITVIISLLVSLIVALTFIPVISRWLLLRPKQLGHEEDSESPAHHSETIIAKTLSRPLLWMRGRRRRQFSLGISAVLIGLAFIMLGGFLFQKVSFDIFAPSKNGDLLTATMTFAPNQTIGQVESTAVRADKIIGDTLGDNFKDASFYSTGSTRQAQLVVHLTPFKKRAPKSPDLASQLNEKFKNFNGALVQVSSNDVGPPAGSFAVRVETPNQKIGYQVANQLKDYLATKELKRPNGKAAHLKDISIGNPDTLTRYNGKPYVSVGAEFDGTDTSTLVILAQNAVRDKFTDKTLAQYGLKKDNLAFDIGFESDNQNSFKTLIYAFPILLVAIFILLFIQFRSLLQPLIIFMAIPFSLFGITAGLWLTHNAFSFFTMLGFFALIGLSLKNTILLTDYANQARRAGHGPADSAAIALQERFRPLIATSFTAIVSLIPLYLSNPFWEGLAVTLMFGLLSSTFLVITIFPYYYLGAEYLRLHISRRGFFKWLGINVVIVGIAVGTDAVPAAVFALLNLGLIIYKIVRRRKSKK